MAGTGSQRVTEEQYRYLYGLAKGDWQGTLRSLGTPERYLRVSADLELHPSLAGWDGEPSMLTILGLVGSGKSWQATRLLGERRCEGWVCRWFDTSEALYTVLQEIGTGDDGKTMAALMHTPMIVLDDVLAERDTPFNIDKLSLILRHRYNRELPTIITSNSMDVGGAPSLDGIHQIEPRLASRLAEGLVVKLAGRDRRMSAAT
jgi:DNA replication protein DnaC